MCQSSVIENWGWEMIHSCLVSSSVQRNKQEVVENNKITDGWWKAFGLNFVHNLRMKKKCENITVSKMHEICYGWCYSCTGLG